MKRKPITDLSIEEANEILDFVYPGDDHTNIRLSFIPVKCENGEKITMGGRSIVGITYRGGINNDGMVLHFDNSKAVLWLYQNGYEIEELLNENICMSEMQSDFSNFAQEVELMSIGEDGFKDGYKHNWNLDYVKKKCKELLEKYYYKF